MSKIFEDYGKEVAKEVTRDNLLTSVKALMQNLNFTVEQAMDALNVPVEDRDGIMSRVATP